VYKNGWFNKPAGKACDKMTVSGKEISMVPNWHYRSINPVGFLLFKKIETTFVVVLYIVNVVIVVWWSQILNVITE
jgi:hypothetical protein